MARMSGSRGGQPYDADEVADTERRGQALTLRRGGATYEAIARQLGYTDKTAAYRAVKHALDAIEREPAEQLLTLELERLDRMQLSLSTLANSGDVKAIDATLRIMDRRAKYLGLDDFERRMADAAEQASRSDRTVVDKLLVALSRTFDQLHLDATQREQANVLLLTNLQQAGLIPATVIESE